MAHKRMFSKDITTSDAFRDMPPSSQALYFHLGMEADDDGFLDSYRNLMRSINASDDDLKILISKRFLILFPSKVIVVKHWKINNTVRKDRYSETKHLEEKRALIVKENGSYTELCNASLPTGLPNGNQVAPQYRIGEDRRDLSANAEMDTPLSEEEPETVLERDDEPPRRAERRTKDKEQVFALFSRRKEPWMIYAHEKKAALELFDRGLDKLKRGLQVMRENVDDQYCPQASTPGEYAKKLPMLNRYIQRKGL